MKVFAGYQMKELTGKVCEIIGVEPGKMEFERFASGEFKPHLLESVRDKRVFLIQSMHSSDSIIAFLLALNTLERSHAIIYPIISYYGYGRQDRREGPGVPISAEFFARCIRATDIQEVLIVDPHNRAIEGFFRKSTLLYGSLVIIPALRDHIEKLDCDPDSLAQIAPDDGRVEFNNFYAKYLGIKRVLYCKKTTLANNVKEVRFNDGDSLPKNATVVQSDDMADTLGTLVGGADAINTASIKVHGTPCRRFIASATHGVFGGQPFTRLEKSPIERLFVTDTIPQNPEKTSKIVEVSIAPVLAEAIKRIFDHRSISEMFRMNFSDPRS